MRTPSSADVPCLELRGNQAGHRSFREPFWPIAFHRGTYLSNNVQFPVYLPVLVLVLPVVAALGYTGWKLRPRPGSTWFTVNMLAIGVWTLGEILVVVNTGLDAKLFWSRWLFLGAGFSVPCWFFFAARYTGRESLHRPATVGVVAGGSLLYLLYIIFLLPSRGGALTAVTLDTSGPITTLSYGWSPLVTSYVLLSYVFFAVASYFLFVKLRRSRGVYRTRNFVLLTGGLMILFGHAISFFGFSPLPNLMLGVLLFPVGGLLGVLGEYTVSFYYWFSLDSVLQRLSFRYSDVVPLARQFIVEEIPTGFVVRDSDGRIVDLNPTARSVLGRNRRIVGKRLAAVVDEDSPLGRLLDGNGELVDTDAEIWVDDADGTRLCFEVRVTAVERGDSEAVGDVIMLHEVTERKENKQKLRQQNERLDQFASIVSHDLRNPLNVAKGHVELAQAGYDESLETAEQALDRMETLIEDTLTIARQSQTVEETTTVDVGALAREAWTNVDTAEATLVVDTDATVRADEGRLQRLFENLYRNSVEHGRADLTVRVGSLGDGFYVEDTGPGIPAAKREAVFEHGYTTDENGTGFGLSIVESAVDAHGWSITVTDGTDGGARFEITQHPGDGEQESSQNETEPSTR